MGIQISALHVRRNSLIHATPARVWQELSSFERLAAWFGRGHRLDAYTPELGGELRLSVEVGGTRRGFGGEILVFEPERELSFANNWDSDGWSMPTFITLRLTSIFDACQVELFHHGFERLGSEASTELESYESGWHSGHLEALKSIAEA